MQLTRRAWILLALSALPLALIGWSEWLRWGVVLWLLLICALLLADWRLGVQPDEWRINRQHEQRLSLAVPNAIVLVVLLRRNSRSLRFWVRDTPPPTFHLAEHLRILSATITGREPIQLAYVIYPPRRGDYHFGDIYLRWESGLRLWHRQTRLPAAASVKVYPNLVDVKKYDLLLRRNRLWELGVRNLHILGAGAEFERLRDYQPDDEYRRINWKATARLGKPISIEYETERSQQIMVLLDVGRMMRSPVGEVAKLDYAINAVLLLAYVAAQKGDKVGLLAFADDVQLWVAGRSGKGQFHRLLEQLYALESTAVESDYNRAFTYFAAKQHKRSLVLVFTDLTGSISTETLVAQMGRLRRGHLPLLVTMRDPTVQQLAQQAVIDSGTLYERTVAEGLLAERQLALEQLQQRGVLTLDAPADQLSIAVINRYLALKARSRI